MLAKVEQNVKRTEVHHPVQLTTCKCQISVGGRLANTKSEVVQEKGCRASLPGRHPPATLAQMKKFTHIDVYV